jgi:hypothetical protein
MESTTYTGTVAGMKKSPWLSSEDLTGLASPDLVIEEVIKHQNVKMDGGRTEPVLFSLKFAGAEKQMILNSTNRRAITKAFGASTKTWRGKTVTVYVQDGVKFGEKVVSGLRLTPHKAEPKPFKAPTPRNKPAQPAAEPLALDPEPETALQKLTRRVAEDKLDLAKVQEWLDAVPLPGLDGMMESEAERVLGEYELLKEVAR